MPWWGWLITVVLIAWTTAGTLAYRNHRKIAREMPPVHDLSWPRSRGRR